VRKVPRRRPDGACAAAPSHDSDARLRYDNGWFRRADFGE